MTHFEANKVKLTLVLVSTKEKLQVTFPDIIIGSVSNSFVLACKELTGDLALGAKVVTKSIYAFKKYLFDIWKRRCERLIIWEKSKNITTNDKRSNKSKFISNNSLAVIEQEVAFDDITGVPLHDSSAMGTPANRQQYSYSINETSLNAYKCERLIIWEKSKNITTNDKRSNKSKFISNNSLAVIEQEVAFDDITGVPLHDSSAMGTPANRQQYSYSINETSLNAYKWIEKIFINDINSRGISHNFYFD
ncbi:hypothetical protein Glove_541g62 [Diversispora epigaea]|uniref:Uncharacterized protein n=1 Tax=Diversispora epigaea TaxID=1348612 RepID=A0A397GGQ6_9GLOM|nr:hypothetical protein Glove_541g62 [Diversispora epigaea]